VGLRQLFARYGGEEEVKDYGVGMIAVWEGSRKIDCRGDRSSIRIVAVLIVVVVGAVVVLVVVVVAVE
jgi:hypothetical protein